MENNKGFTLVELLAVIVILGLLMAIAIPSVTKYITQSRVKTLVSTIDSYVTAATTAVNDNEFGAMSNPNVMYYIPVSNEEIDSCISLEKGGTNPFGNWKEAYVVVNYDTVNYSYDYYFTFYDDAGYGMKLTRFEDISASSNQVVNPSPVNEENITGQLNDRATNVKVLDSSSCDVSTATNGKGFTIVPDGAAYYVGVTSKKIGEYTGYTAKFEPGDKMPTTIKTGDVFVFGDYEYKYNYYYYGEGGTWEKHTAQNGWGVRVRDKTKTSYASALSKVNEEAVVQMSYTYSYCTNLLVAPEIPNSVTDMGGAFTNCTSLTSVPNLSNNAKNMNKIFYGCVSLTTAPVIPDSATNIGRAFYGCTSLTGTVTINADAPAYGSCFYNVDFAAQNLKLAGDSPLLSEIGATGINYR